MWAAKKSLVISTTGVLLAVGLYGCSPVRETPIGVAPPEVAPSSVLIPALINEVGVSYYPGFADALKVCLTTTAVPSVKPRLVIEGKRYRPVEVKTLKTSTYAFNNIPLSSENQPGAEPNRQLNKTTTCYMPPGSWREGDYVSVTAILPAGKQSMVQRQRLLVYQGAVRGPAITSVQLVNVAGKAGLLVTGRSWEDTTFYGALGGAPRRQMARFDGGDPGGRVPFAFRETLQFSYRFASQPARKGQDYLVRVEGENGIGQTSRFAGRLTVDSPAVKPVGEGLREAQQAGSF